MKMNLQTTQPVLDRLDKILGRIQENIFTHVVDLDLTAWKTKEPVSYLERMSGEKIKLQKGDRWGDLFDCAWMRFCGTVPKSVKGKTISLVIDLNGEANVVDGNGIPKLCLTTTATQFGNPYEGKAVKKVVPFITNAAGGDAIDIWADVGNNDLFGNLKNSGELKEAYIAIHHRNIEALYYDYEVLYDLWQNLPQDSARYRQILNSMHKTMAELVDFTKEAVDRAQQHLQVELSKENGDYPLRVSALGHAHIDLAWLWPIRETVRKGARTFSHVLAMMAEYPEYLFGASQPQLYQWMKIHYPKLYSGIKKAVADKRWEILGGMWVEADTNVPSGESLVRQFLYGKKYFQDEFGQVPTNLFLPDVFGYSGALPQIMKKSGIDYFVTTKLSWDKYVKYPHETFHWQGIDGSKVLEHMPPEATYNGPAAPRAILKGEREYQDKDVSNNFLMLFGIGDGGGGPGTDHLERLKRSKNLNGMAPVKQEFVEKFFERLERNAHLYHTWVGELYLGFHQGTYTTQARNKRFNRKMEFSLRDAEFKSALAQIISKSDYPAEKYELIWKEVLLYQFHDIIPGSSIKRVYDESLERYKVLMNETKILTVLSTASVNDKINTKEYRNPVVVHNTLSWDRREWLKINEKWQLVSVPSMGHAVTENISDERSIPNILAKDNLLENDILKVVFHQNGKIASIFDKKYGREVLYSGKNGNDLTVYGDDDGDAWDFSTDYRHRVMGRFELVESSVFVDGPKAIMRQTKKFGESVLDQDIILTAGSRKIEFITQVDWQENGKMLRTAFPVDIHTNESTAEIQYGYVKRPNHNNTDWELRQFEISAHKWIDLSQPDYGVALLNDCKYGHFVEGNILDINLLRSSSWPDPTADRAEHKFTYALYPHYGNHIDGNVVHAGYELNVPLSYHLEKPHDGSIPSNWAFVKPDKNNIIVDAVKRSEENESIVVRMYESEGKNAEASLKFGVDIQSAELTNLMEEPITNIPICQNEIRLNFNPFAIQTIKIVVKD